MTGAENAAAPRRWRRLVGVASFALLVVGVSGAWLAPLPPVLTPPGGVVLPDTVMTFSRGHDAVEADPPGPALLSFKSGQLVRGHPGRSVQQVMVGADGVTFRTLDAVYEDNGLLRNVFLAPDGRSVLVTDAFGFTNGIVQVDLVTGERRELPLAAPQSVVIYAWSPDGRYVAYGRSDWESGDHSMAQAQAVQTSGTLVLLDLTTGTHTPLPQVGPVATAAFSPDSTRLALQSGVHAFVIDLDGTVLHDLAIPVAGLGIVSHAAWSPDGRWIAVTGSYLVPAWWGPSQIVAVDARGGSGQRGPFDIRDEAFLGWRDSDHILTAQLTTGLGPGPQDVHEFSLLDGASSRIAQLAAPRWCAGFLNTCDTAREPVAAINLLPQLRVVPADTLSHDNTGLRWSITGAALLIAAVGLALTRSLT